MSPRASVRFWPAKADLRVASTRIRCLQVVDALRRAGVDADLFAPGQVPAVLVLSKHYDEDALRRALALRELQGTRLVLDLCDNHFHTEGGSAAWQARAERLRFACRNVDRVVAASDALADVVRQSCGDGVPVTVLPDALDLGVADTTDRQGGDALHALRLRLFTTWHRVAPGRRLLWFGNHGASYAGSGLEDLGRIAEALAHHHRASPLTLVVVSNRWGKFRHVRKGWTWPSLYLPWSMANFARALQASDVALIPVQRNAFTLCKTNNRLATAFTQGLAVAADTLPSYEEFRDVAVLDDWGSGLGALMADAVTRGQRVAVARERLTQHYGLEAIARRWAALLGELAAGPSHNPRP